MPIHPTQEEELNELGKDPLSYWQKKLPGMGGVYNPKNNSPYHYGALNPIRFMDPDGNEDMSSPWSVGFEWLTGTGPTARHFEKGDPFTTMLSQHEHIQNVKANAISNLESGNGITAGSNNYSLAGLQGVIKYLKDYSTIATAGQTGNIAVTYLGSYGLKYSITNIDNKKGTAVINFEVTNRSSIGSATRPPVIGYSRFWRNNIESRVNSFFSSGPLSPKEQTFKWSEIIKFTPP